MEFWIIVVAFFFIALIYSSVGFGGGSSYTALLAVYAFSPDEVKSASLVCNIVVVAGSVLVFWREGALTLRQIFPYLILSMPLAFVGATMPISNRGFFLLLASALLLSSLGLIAQSLLMKRNVPSVLPGNPIRQSVVGGAVGFLSGVVGIGGGIFLSPVLHFMAWHSARIISGLAAVFILMNSVMGLAGQFTRGIPGSIHFLWPLALAVFIGGQLGARAGAKKFNPSVIRQITAMLIFVASMLLFWKHG